MNFLEELVAEWYEYKGYFIIRNRTLNKLPGGGYEGEVDILAYNPRKNEVIHVETSSDSYKWEDRLDKFREKFRWTIEEYRNVFGIPSSVKQIKKIVVVSFSMNPKGDMRKIFESKTGAELITVPQFLTMIVDELRTTLKSSETIPENLSMLRAIQLIMRHGGLK